MKRVEIYTLKGFEAERLGCAVLTGRTMVATDGSDNACFVTSIGQAFYMKPELRTGRHLCDGDANTWAILIAEDGQKLSGF